MRGVGVILALGLAGCTASLQPFSVVGKADIENVKENMIVIASAVNKVSRDVQMLMKEKDQRDGVDDP
jgi:hypothetical protein